MSTITSPAVLWMKTRTGRDNCLNLNWYRNAHFHKLNKAKKAYKAIMKESIIALPGYDKVTIHYKYYLRQKCDMGNVHSIVEKFFLDALVEFGKLPDDNCEIVSSDSKEFAGYNREDPHCVIEITALDEYGNKLNLVEVTK